MKSRYWLPLCAIVVMAVAATAQPRMVSPEDQAKQLKEQLKLTDKQTEDVTKILTEQREKARKLREGGEMGPEMRDAFMKIAEETDKKMMKVLNEDQQKEYKKIQEERRQARGRRRSG